MPRLRSPLHKLVRGIALLLLVALAAGCSRTVAVGSGQVLHMALTEYRLNPDRVRVPAGELTIVVRNLGKLTHNLALSRNNQTQVQTKPIPPGSRAQLTVILTPGTYVLDSSLFSDQALGLYGTLIVTG